MEKDSKHTPKLRVKVASRDAWIVDLKTPDGMLIGYAANGRPGGPNLLVTGIDANVRTVYQHLLMKPGIQSIRGKLILLFLDRLDHQRTQAALDTVAHCIRPISGTLFLDAHAIEHSIERSLHINMLIDQIVRFCARHDVTIPNGPPEPPAIRDFAN